MKDILVFMGVLMVGYLLTAALVIVVLKISYPTKPEEEKIRTSTGIMRISKRLTIRKNPRKYNLRAWAKY